MERSSHSKSISGKLTSKNSVVTNPSSPTLQDTVSQGLGVFTNLFGQETFKEIALNPHDLFDDSKGARSEKQVLYSKPAKGKKTAQLWNSILENLLARFNNIDISTIRKIWVAEDQHLPNNADDLDSDEALTFRGLVQQCFGVIEEDKPKRVTLYFNYGLLHRFVFPPVIETQKGILKIDKSHLSDYIRQLMQDGTLLRVYKEHEYPHQLIARPIFLGSKKMREMPRHYTMIIDRSGSMGSSLDGLIKNVRQFIEKLNTFDSKAKVRIVFFNDKLGPVQEFLVSSSTAIEKFMSSVQSEGGTRLFGSIGEELDHLLDKKITRDFLTTVIFFSDGKDNESGPRTDVLMRVTQKLEAFKEKNLKVYAIGYGPEYDHVEMDAIAKRTNSPLIHLKSIDDFKQIYDCLNEMQYEQQLIDFLVKTGDTTRFDIPITLDGNAKTPDILIPFQENNQLEIGVNGRKIFVTVPDEEQVPLATTNDQLIELLSKVHTIVANDKINADQKLKALRPLKEQTEKKSLDEARKTIEIYTRELNEIIKTNNKALEQSLQSRARIALGYTKKEVQHNNDCIDNVCDNEDNLGTDVSGIRSNTGRKLMSIEPEEDENKALQYRDSVKRDILFSDPNVKTSDAAPAILPWFSFVTKKVYNLLNNDAKIQQFISPVVENTLLLTQGSKNSKESYQSFFDSGRWDSEVNAYPNTGVPVFTYRVFKEGEEVGFARFYKYPLLCRSGSGDRHNVLELNGVLSSVQINTPAIKEVCESLPPTVLEQVMPTVNSAIQHGTIKGISNVTGYALQKTGFSDQVANIAKKIMYYGGFFATRFYSYYNAQQSKNQEPTGITTATYQAVVDTSVLLLTNTAIQKVCDFSGWLGQKATKAGWNKTGQLLKTVQHYGGYGRYVYDGYAQGATNTIVSVVTGSTTEHLVEDVGTTSVNALLYTYEASLKKKTSVIPINRAKEFSDVVRPK